VGGTIDRVHLRQLSYFTGVAEQLHFGSAVERLDTSAPSLSQEISNLQRELGTPYLVCGRQKVELTTGEQPVLNRCSPNQVGPNRPGKGTDITRRSSTALEDLCNQGCG
jgi:hypothetical protein